MTWPWIALASLASIVVATAVIGALLPKGHSSTRTVRLRASPEAVWATIADFEAAPSWRSEVRKVERLPDRDGHPVWLEVSRHGRMPLEVLESRPPGPGVEGRLVGRIADANLPFGGSWTYEVADDSGGARVTLTENGEIYNPMFRFMARFVFGYHATMDGYLRALGRKFGESVTPGPP